MKYKRTIIFLILTLILLMLGTTLVSASNNDTAQNNMMKDYPTLNNNNNIIEKNTNNQIKTETSNTKNLRQNTSNEKISTVIIPSSYKTLPKNTYINLGGKLQTKSGSSLSNQNVTLTIDNKVHTANTNSNGYFSIRYLVSTYPSKNISFYYTGNHEYNESFAKFTINVIQSSRITLYNMKKAVNGTTIKVSGKLLSNGAPIKGENITININDNEYTATTTKTGYFKINYDITDYDTKNVTYYFKGTKNYESSSNSTVILVKQPTYITTYKLGIAKINSTIKLSGKLYSNKKPLKNQKVIISIGKNNFTVKTYSSGYFTTKYNVSDYQTKNVTFTYPETADYESSNNTNLINVKQATTIHLYNIKFVDNYNALKISGKLLSNNNGLKRQDITVKINGENIKTTTLTSGYFSVNYNVTKMGTYKIYYKYNGNNTYESVKTNKTIKLMLKDSIIVNASVVNQSVKLLYDKDNESAITKSILTVNGKSDLTGLGADYKYVDENGTYTINGAEIRRVMKLDSICQQLYGFTPKYTFFRAVNSNIKYIISREKWNVILRSLYEYHVKQGFNSVNTPYSITVNLTNKIRYYPVFFDAQEMINGESYTCGPTSMSMISQALNWYSSESKLSGLYSTTRRDGTYERNIISNSPAAHMKLTDIADNKNSVMNALLSGKMVFWHIKGHYMCIVAYNNVSDKFLCLNPSGPSHNINSVSWSSWSQICNVDRRLKDNGFMAVSPYWNLNASDLTHAKNYYSNMGGKYVAPNNSEYPNSGSCLLSVCSLTPSVVKTTDNQTVLSVYCQVKKSNSLVRKGNVTVLINNKYIRKLSIKKGIVFMDYVLPVYDGNSFNLTLKYVNSSNKSDSCKINLTVNRYPINKIYTNVKRSLVITTL